MKNAIVAAILVVCTGCVEDPYQVRVNVAEDWSYKVKLPASEVYYNEVEYSLRVPNLVQESISSDSPIEYNFDGQDTRSNSSGVSKNPLYVPSPLRGYGLVLGFHKHLLKGCIKRDVFHANLQVRGGPSGAFWDLHIPVWMEAGRVCTGVYITWNPPAGANWCRKTCTPTYTEVRGLIASALIAAGMTAMIAEVLASIATPAVIAGLAL